MIDISKGIELFNNADFFAAHDFFEELWIESEQKDRLFFQGMVQIAVGCYHLVSGNYKGAQSQYRKATEKLNNYVPNYYGVDLELLLNQVDLIKRNIADHFVDRRNEINLELIPKIELKNKF